MIPTEHEATLAVEAAARKAYDNGAPVAVEWDELPHLVKLDYRRAVLPLVWAALEALPDRRHEAWLVGHLAPNNAVNPYPQE